MSNPIAPITASILPVFKAPSQIPAGAGVEPAAEPGNQLFESMVKTAIAKVEGLGENAKDAVDKFLGGENEDLHRVTAATQRAELAFEMFLQVKNKLVQAYQEVMRTQM